MENQPSSTGKVYKTPEYVRKAQRRYKIKNMELVKSKSLEIYYKKKNGKNSDEYMQKRRDYQIKHYHDKKLTGITAEEKAAKAKYMREYRARKKMEKENIN